MKKDKDWIEGSIQISSPSGMMWDDYISITIRDENAVQEFIEVRIKYEDFTKAIMNRPSPIEFKVRGLDKVGKVRISERLDFEIPKDLDKWRDEGMIELHSLAKEAAGEGWEPSLYFGSKESFFTKDGSEYARTQKYMYLTPKEHKAWLKANPPKKFTL